MTQSGHACFAISKQSRGKEQSSIGKIGAELDTEPEPDRDADLGGRALIVPSSIQSSLQKITIA